MAQDFDPQDVPESLVQEASIGGYESDLFIQSVENNLKCCKCKLVLREPHRLLCCNGSICKSCIPNEEPCSLCHQLNSAASYDEGIFENVMRLNVRCKHYREKCEWRGELVALDGHLSHDCQYRKLKCPYGCPENISFCHLENHKSDKCILRPPEKKADTNSKNIEKLRQDVEWLKQNGQPTQPDATLIDELKQLKDRQTMFDLEIQEQNKQYNAKLANEVASIEQKLREQTIAHDIKLAVEIGIVKTKQTDFELQLQTQRDQYDTKLVNERTSFEQKLQALEIRHDTELKQLSSTIRRQQYLFLLAFVVVFIAMYDEYFIQVFVSALVFWLVLGCCCYDFMFSKHNNND